MTGLRRVFRVGLTAAVVAGAVSCGGEEQRPTTLPPAPADKVATPSPSPSASPPTPTEAPEPVPTAQTPAGAAEFVTYWFEELNRANLSGDSAVLHDISDDDCVSCNNFIRTIDTTYASGGQITGSRWEVVGAEAVDIDVKDGTIVETVVNVTEGSVLDAADAVTDESPSEEAIFLQVEVGPREEGGVWSLGAIEMMD